MIKRLKVKNYVLIDELEINFENGLTIITGETGAGKSILLGALNLITGQRADASTLLDSKQKCVIEAYFDLADIDVQEFFRANDLDNDLTTIIRREINTEGKSRAFINDTPVSLSLLKELTAQLIDIHSQHETLLLNNNRYQLGVLDAWAENEMLLKDYQLKLKEFREETKELNALILESEKAKSDQDYFQFQFDELNDANLKDGETESLEIEQQKLAHAEEINTQLAKVSSIVSENDDNILSQLTIAQQLISQSLKYDKNLESIENRLKILNVELKDIASEIQDVLLSSEINPDRLVEVEDRLSFIYKLIQKHRCKNIADLILVREEYESKLNSVFNAEKLIEEKSSRLKQLKNVLQNAGDELSKSRHAAVDSLLKKMRNYLSNLALPDANLKINFIPVEGDDFFQEGLEKIQLLFAANKGSEYREIQKVASGGEMSRLMLCIKAVLAEKGEMPTVIFDEIDTGISGETASKVGNILLGMSKNHQVFAITHLPQIAAKGNAHYFVFKESNKSVTRTKLKQLTSDERINEIARLLSGEKLSPAAIGNARELLNK
jgi:DNA repair protein RecN (Recombination protein N)